MTYRVGVVGFRRGTGPAHIFASIPDCEIAAICDLDERVLAYAHEQFPGVQTFTDYSEMLRQDLDIVFVATPVPIHAEHTIAALEAGCHVLQEVTLANSMEQCRDILAAVRAHPQQKFMLAENCCYWAQVMAWREMFAQGLLGEFMYAEAEYIHEIGSLLLDAGGKPTWRASLPPIYYCTHSLGPLLMITGQRCVSACGLHTGSKRHRDLGHINMEVGIFQTSNGGVIKILCGFGVVREPMFHYYSLYGTKGTLETARPPLSLRTHAYLEAVPHLQNMIEIPLGYDVPGAPPQARLGGHGTAEYHMIQDFLQCIREDTRPPIDIFAALDMALPGLCAHESAINGGKLVLVPDWRE